MLTNYSTILPAFTGEEDLWDVLSLVLRTHILFLPNSEYWAIGLGTQNVLILGERIGGNTYRENDTLVLFPENPLSSSSKSFKVRLAAIHRCEDMKSIPFPVPLGYLPPAEFEAQYFTTQYQKQPATELAVTGT